MAYFSKESVRVWFVVTLVTTYVILDDDNSSPDLDNNPADLKTQHWGIEPGDTVTAFRVPTLEGEFSYSPGALRGALIIHAFTHKSGFLECMWNNESSLADLVRELPESTHVLFLSRDDSAFEDAIWMRKQVYRAAVQHGCQDKYFFIRFKQRQRSPVSECNVLTT